MLACSGPGQRSRTICMMGIDFYYAVMYCRWYCRLSSLFNQHHRETPTRRLTAPEHRPALGFRPALNTLLILPIWERSESSLIEGYAKGFRTC